MQAVVEVDEREIELAKFFQLAEILPYRLKMFSPYIDSYWHEIATDHSAFRLKFETPTNINISHLEAGSDTPEHIEWVAAYETSFGPLPKIWFHDLSGQFDQIAYQAYLESGEVYAAWDCSPAITKPAIPQKAK